VKLSEVNALLAATPAAEVERCRALLALLTECVAVTAAVDDALFRRR